MTQLSNRLAGLSPDKQKLLERLRKQAALQESAAEPTNHETAADANDLLDFGEGAASSDTKGLYRRFYDSVNRQLDTGVAGKFSFFLNFGYVADGNPQDAVVQLPQHCLNRDCTKLVLELIGDTDLTGRTVLDVGCGRGGTVHVLKTYFKPGRVVGIDLSSRAVRFSRSAHTFRGVDFVQGDAERLPFRDGAVDVVTNIESSHSYPDTAAFYAETARVLKPGGSFLYTDVLEIGRMAESLNLLRTLGYRVSSERDITPNVLRSCKEIGRVHQQTFDRRNDSSTLGEFLGLPGSNIHTAMEAGTHAYRIWRFTKEGFVRTSKAVSA